MTTFDRINRKRSKFDRIYTKRIFKDLMKQLAPVLNKIPFNYNIVEEIPILITDDIKDTHKEMIIKVGYEFARSLKKDQTDMEKIYQQEMIDYYERYALESLTQVNTTSIETMQKLLKQIIAETEPLGYGVEKTASIIRKRLYEEYGTTARWRAKRIAQTEILRASNEGIIVNARSSGVPYRKVWLTGGRSKTERHTLIPAWSESNPLGLHGQTVDGEQNFLFQDLMGEIISTPAPGQTGTAHNDINCKCVIDIINVD